MIFKLKKKMTGSLALPVFGSKLSRWEDGEGGCNANTLRLERVLPERS